MARADAPTPADRAVTNGPDPAGTGQRSGSGFPGRMPTIHDVAERLGLAASTVSRAFSRPERVNAGTRERVLTAAAEMGYQPSPIARALPSGRTNTLALLVPDITNPFFFGIIRAAERHAAAAGYTLVLADTNESADTETASIDKLARTVDGFVLSSSRLPDGALRSAYDNAPLVLINRKVTDVPSVVIDSADGMRQVVEHLASLGHRRIVYVGGPRASWSDKRRWRALQNLARRLDLEVSKTGPFAPTVSAGTSAADAALLSDATAVVTFNDLQAIGIVRRFAARGIAVPEQISVVGCDDIFGADFCHPPLTTLSAPVEDAGRCAVDLLLTALKDAGAAQRSPVSNESVRPVVLPSHLVIRDSTTVAPSKS